MFYTIISDNAGTNSHLRNSAAIVADSHNHALEEFEMITENFFS